MTACQEEKVNIIRQSVSLSSLPRGGSAVIVSVPDYPALYPLGLRPGRLVQNRGCQMFGGPFMVITGERQVAVGRKLAEQILVQTA